MLTPRPAVLRLALLVAAGGALLVGAPTAAVAAPAPNGTALVDGFGMKFTGLDQANDVRVEIAGTRYLITDNAPITAGAGCATTTVAGGRFGVFCQIPLNANGTRKPFSVKLGAGADRVTSTAAAGMKADGGPGNDTLLGGPLSDDLRDAFGGDTLRGGAGSDVLTTRLSQNDGLADILDGGPGDDDVHGGPNPDSLTGGSGQDFLRGGLGADTMDPGADPGDTVSYLDNEHEGPLVVASLDGNPNDGINIGGISERDNVAKHTPILIGSHSRDILIGNEFNNHLEGNLGDDTLLGLKGADFIRGSNGNDTLSGNDLFGPIADGSIDTLNGSDDTDTCRVPFSGEADVTIACENIDTT